MHASITDAACRPNDRHALFFLQKRNQQQRDDVDDLD